MTADNRLSKVDILIQQKKFAEAEQVLRTLLAEDAYNVHYLALLAEVNLQLDQFERANEIINGAIGMAPDSPYLYYIRARIAIQQDKDELAQDSLQQAIALDPYDADYFALLANLRLSQRRFDEALELANKALEIDPAHLLALNSRSTALLKLNRKAESFETIEGALREDPNNAYTHANYGWGLLERGDYKKAKEHFKEALQQNPNSEYAQAGLLEALKATNPVYRLFLRYSFFMGNLTSRYQFGVIIGFYLATRALRALAMANEALQPFLIPIVALLTIFAFSTWIIKPISNLFLRFNKYGQLLLSKEEKMSSNLVAASFAIFLLGGIAYVVLRDIRFISLVAYGFAMMVPLGVMFSPAKYKYSLIIYAALMALVGGIAIGITFSGGELLNVMSGIFLIGFVAFQWVANFILVR